MSSGFSRRGLFSLFLRTPSRDRASGHNGPATPASDPAPATVPDPARVAVIQGRYCLALTSFCSTCLERCPVPGAMTQDRGLPAVVPEVCTGCGICHDVCPAPRNAVLLLPSRRTSGA